MTRERPYLHCHLSYTHFFPRVDIHEAVSPRKGGVKEMPVQNDSIIRCINNTKPQKEQNYSHISSIIPGKEPNQRTSDKVESETTNK